MHLSIEPSIFVIAFWIFFSDDYQIKNFWIWLNLWELSIYTRWERPYLKSTKKFNRNILCYNYYFSLKLKLNFKVAIFYMSSVEKRWNSFRTEWDVFPGQLMASVWNTSEVIFDRLLVINPPTVLYILNVKTVFSMLISLAAATKSFNFLGTWANGVTSYYLMTISLQNYQFFDTLLRGRNQKLSA